MSLRAAKISVYLQIADLCSTRRVAGGGRVFLDGPACCRSQFQLACCGPKVSTHDSTRTSVSCETFQGLRFAARPRRSRGLLETMEVGEGRARLGERTHFADPGRLSRKGGPGSIHSQTQPLSLVWPSLGRPFGWSVFGRSIRRDS